MFKRKRKELTTEDASDSLAPWEMLDEAGIAEQTARLEGRRPGRGLEAIARRLDMDAVACFDKGPDGAAERHYPGFSAWFDAALQDAQDYGEEG